MPMPNMMSPQAGAVSRMRYGGSGGGGGSPARGGFMNQNNPAAPEPGVPRGMNGGLSAMSTAMMPSRSGSGPMQQQQGLDLDSMQMYNQDLRNQIDSMEPMLGQVIRDRRDAILRLGAIISQLRSYRGL